MTDHESKSGPTLRPTRGPTRGTTPGPARSGLRPLTRLLVAVVLLAPLGAALAKLGRTEAEHVLAVVGEPTTRAATTAPAASSPDATPRPLLGFAINAHHISDLPLYLEGVDAVADLGANALIVVTPMFQRKVDSTRIGIVRSRCPTEQQLTAILRRAQQHGMYTILMPILLIEDPGESDWRGVIRPTDWVAWWASYEETFGRFVDLAVALDVDMLSIGSELNRTESQIDRWTALVERVRARYDGRLMYSANWDRYPKVEIWPLVDVMSVSSYFELERDRPGAPEADLVRAWAPIREALLETARRWNKPMLLSEVGYPSLPWANAHPWNYVPEDDTRADHAAQARSWRAFFAAWSEEIAAPAGPVVGFCGYRWDPYHRGGEHDTGYGIVGKPSMEVIRRGFAEIRASAAARSRAASGVPVGEDD